MQKDGFSMDCDHNNKTPKKPNWLSWLLGVGIGGLIIFNYCNGSIIWGIAICRINCLLLLVVLISIYIIFKL